MILLSKIKQTYYKNEFCTKRYFAKKYPDYIDLLFINIGSGLYSRLYITNTGFMKLLIHLARCRKDSRLKHFFKKIKQIGEKEVDINEIMEKTGLSRQRIHQYRTTPMKRYPELSLVEGEDYYYYYRMILFRESAVEKIKRRQKLKPSNKLIIKRKVRRNAGA